MTNTQTNDTGRNWIQKVFLVMILWALALAPVFLLFVIGIEMYQPSNLGYPAPVKNYKPVDSISIHGFIASPSTDTTPVSITLNHSTTLTIPRNYLFDAALINPWPDMWLTIKTGYPDFQGVSEATIKANAGAWYNEDNIIVIRRETSKSMESVKANKLLAMDRIAKASGPLNNNPHTLTSYVKYRGSPENSLLINCPAPTRKLTITDFCEVEVAVAPDFLVTYEFRLPLLPHWQEIDDGVMRLLNSFVKH